MWLLFLIICIFSFGSSLRNSVRRPRSMTAIHLVDELSSSLPVIPLAGGGLVVLAALKGAAYVKQQYAIAEVVGGIPRASVVAELDAQDGADLVKAKEKSRVNEQLILESVGKANAQGQGMGLKGRLRSRSQDVASKSCDCVVSIGAMERAGDAAAQVVNEAFRLLRPGGLLVFVEPVAIGASSTLALIESVFPREIVSTQPAGAKPKVAERSRAKKSGGRRTRSEAVDSSALEEDVPTDANSDDQPEPGGALAGGGGVLQLTTRPGITWQTVSSLFLNSIAGIAVRP